jgi:hypothetical protein
MLRKFSTDSGTEMRHSDSVKIFLKVGYRLFHTRFTQFMKGYGKNEFNSVVPDKRTFLSIDTVEGMDPKSLKPGILDAMMDLFDKDMVVKIATDGKKINACKDQLLGKINLWGYESRPTTAEQQVRMQEEQEVVKNVTNSIEQYEQRGITTIGPSLQVLKQETLKLVRILSNRIKDFREVKVSTNRRLLRLQKQAGEPWHKSRLAPAISGIKTVILHMDNNIESELDTINKLCHFLAKTNGVKHLFCKRSVVEMKHQFFLVCLGTVLTNVEDDDKVLIAQFMPELVKQRTSAWHSIRNMAKGTGSTLHKMIGLESLKGMKEHFDCVMNKKKKADPGPELQSRFQHGTLNEPNCIATLVGKVLPALYPEICFYKEGCYVVEEGDNPYLVVSPDGSGRQRNN